MPFKFDKEDDVEHVPFRVTKRLSLTVGLMIVSALFLLSGQALAVDQKAVVQTTASDWTSAAHAIIDVNPILGARDTQLDLFPTNTSDWIIRTYGQYFYLIGRYYTDSLTKFSVDAPTVPIYQESVLPDGLASGNPHDMIFVNSTKAYMPMYETDKLWIINPQDGSKTGGIDLSAYNDGDGIPEMHTGAIVDGKLFLILQRLDRDSNWDPANPAYIIVIDTAKDLEMDTTGGAGGLKGIALAGRNPNAIQYLPENNTIYLACTGKYPGFDAANPYLYTGGIFTIDPDTYAITQLVDDGPDGPDGDHPYGAISGITVVSPDKGYFIGYMGYGNNSFRTFNPTTGATGDIVTSLEGKGLVGNESGAAVDENGLVWVSMTYTNYVDVFEHSVLIIDPATDSTVDNIDTNLNPGGMGFCPPTIWEGSNQVNSATGRGTISVSGDAGTVSEITTYLEDDFPNAQNLPALPFVDGLVGVTVEGIVVGSDVNVTLSFPTPRADDAVFYKIDAAGDYYEFPANRITEVNDTTIIIRLTDGGMGDRDGAADGTIADPGGFAMTPPVDPKKTTNDVDDSCFIQSLF